MNKTAAVIGSAGTLFVAHALPADIVRIGGRAYTRTEMRVNDTTWSSQHYPCVAVLHGGRFVVAWETWHQVAFSDCFARVYEPDLSAGPEMLLNQDTSGWEWGPAVAPLPGGGFAAAWGRGSVWTRVFNSEAVPTADSEFVAGHNTWPAIVTDANGNALVVGTYNNGEAYGRGGSVPPGSPWAMSGGLTPGRSRAKPERLPPRPADPTAVSRLPGPTWTAGSWRLLRRRRDAAGAGVCDQRLDGDCRRLQLRSRG